jgi:predicted RNA binding protein YcfA (HicA-like mRNA interferase family)
MASDVRFEVVRRQFESQGWVLDRIRGSHHIFSKAGRGSFPVPVHKGRVKASYVKAIQKRLARGEDEATST